MLIFYPLSSFSFCFFFHSNPRNRLSRMMNESISYEWNKHFVHFKRVAQKRSHVKAQTQGLEPIEAIITFNLNCVLFYTRPKSLWYTQTNGTHLCNSALQRMRHTFSDHTHCVNAFCQLFANVCVLLCAHRHISNVRLFFFLLLWNSNKRIGHRS